MNPPLGMNWTWIKVASICLNVIRILIYFLFFQIPLILILVQFVWTGLALILILI